MKGSLPAQKQQTVTSADYLAAEGYLWETVQRGSVDMEQMEKGSIKLIGFWKSVYLRKE